MFLLRRKKMMNPETMQENNSKKKFKHNKKHAQKYNFSQSLHILRPYRHIQSARNPKIKQILSKSKSKKNIRTNKNVLLCGRKNIETLRKTV